MHPGPFIYTLNIVITSIPKLHLFSQVPKAVSAWKEDLRAKNRPKVAASIAHPDEHAEFFSEGWQDALQREQQPSATNDHSTST